MSVHILTVLAYKGGDRVSSEFLAASVNTNPVIVRRLLLALQKAKLIETRKGAGLGSRLSRSPARIDLAEVYRAVNPPSPLAMLCRKPNARCPVGQCINAVLKHVSSAAEAALQGELARFTLASILGAVQGGRPLDISVALRVSEKRPRLAPSKVPR